jgi:hypothetical protein
MNGHLRLLVATLVLVAGPAANADSGPKLLGSADFRIVRDQMIRVPITLNGRAATMDLALQNFATVIDSSYVDSFGLKARTAPRHILYGGTELTQYARLTGFAIGSMKMEDPPIYITPDSAPAVADASQLPNVGVIGMDQLRNYDYELDFANNKLNFYSPNHWHRQVVYWTDKYTSAPLTLTHFGGFVFPVVLEGKRIEAVISAVGGHSRIRTQALQAIFGAAAASDDVQTETYAGGKSVHYRMMTLSGLELSDQSVRFNLDPEAVDPACILTSEGTRAYYYQGDQCRGVEAPVFLGLEVIRNLHLYFAVNDQIVYFSDAKAGK